MKHKHADLIHAWADGAEIQHLIAGFWYTTDKPHWYADAEYRIKPEEKKPVVRWLWAYELASGGYEHTQFLTQEEADIYPLVLIKLEWSRTEFSE